MNTIVEVVSSFSTPQLVQVRRLLENSLGSRYNLGEDYIFVLRLLYNLNSVETFRKQQFLRDVATILLPTTVLDFQNSPQPTATNPELPFQPVMTAQEQSRNQQSNIVDSAIQ